MRTILSMQAVEQIKTAYERACVVLDEATAREVSRRSRREAAASLQALIDQVLDLARRAETHVRSSVGDDGVVTIEPLRG